MKKTIIALLALAGMALGEELILTLPVTQTLTLQTSKLTTEWDSILNTVKTFSYGLYYGGQNNVLGSLNIGNNEGSWVNSENSGAITMNGRDGVAGAAFVMVLGNDLTSGTVITSITLSATNQTGRSNLGASAGGNVTLGLGIVDSEGNILKSAGGKTINVGQAGNNNTQELSLSDGFTWQEGYKVVAIFDGTYGSGGFGSVDYTLENISVTATLIPEPATATLSLLAFCGLVARRRRH